MAFELFEEGAKVLVMDTSGRGRQEPYKNQVGTVVSNDGLLTTGPETQQRRAREGQWWIIVLFDDGMRIEFRLNQLVRAEVEGKNKYKVRFLTGARKKMSDTIKVYFAESAEGALMQAESLVISTPLPGITQIRVEEGE